ncbi:GFA family protein [Shewanella algae]|uniref:GFA family protein n=1 Tax=Shewanella algae TaxID=38313 RepID=UPI000698FC78|nr:GFA family protein [Shewanella algae]
MWAFPPRIPRHSRHFCAVCGSPLPKAVEGGHLLQIPAGSLDDEPGLTPQAHIFCQTRAAWDQALEQVPGLEQGPV